MLYHKIQQRFQVAKAKRETQKGEQTLLITKNLRTHILWSSFQELSPGSAT
jgi:hypothetical protein